MTKVNLSIDVPNIEKGVQFYSEVFGFTEQSRPFPTMAIMDANNVMLCIHEKAAGSVPAPDTDDVRRYSRHWTPVHADFHVSDFSAVLEKAERAGASIEQRFDNSGQKSAAFCSDPFGNGFCIISG